MNRRSLLAALVTAAIGVTTLAACAGTDRRSVLSFFFDGVPDPSLESAPSTPAPRPAALSPIGSIPAVIPTTRELPQLTIVGTYPLEAATSFDEALRMLPVDAVGAVDWMAAVRERLLIPRLLPASRTPVEPPYSVDTLIELGVGHPDRAFLDLDLELFSSDNRLFAARFPHSSHTTWLSCASCHPGATSMPVEMDRILAGESCGQCHGKVAFDLEVGCARCHTALTPPSAAEVEAEASRVGPAAGPESVARGAELYARNCMVCHGAEGDGAGRLAEHFVTKPRDFTSGKYKFRSTIGSSPPTDHDIFRVVSRGVPGTSMPAWSALPIDDRWALVHYVKTFSDRFEREAAGQPLDIPEPPPGSPELLAMGEELYRGAGCHNCHGEDGRGGGPSAAALVDDWGEPIVPYDLTSGRPLKGGDGIENYYRVILSGLPGTPMPGFGLALQPEQTWAIAAYTLSFREQAGSPLAVRGDIEFERREDLVVVAAQGQVGVGEEDPHALSFSGDLADVPPAVFPHWAHRIRFKCSSCHPNLFEMKAGANPITMDGLRRGEYCATCHNGTIAWQVGFTTCVRCHEQR